MTDTLFFVPIGPNDVQRACWAVRSIRKYSQNYKIYLLLDGPPTSSLSAELSGADIEIASNIPPSNGNWGKIWLMQCSAMVKALHSDEVSSDAIFVKFDADALLVRSGLTERARAIFASRSSAGQIGQCFSNVNGGRLSNSGWANFMGKMLGWRGLARFAKGARLNGEGQLAGLEAFRLYRTLLQRAIANGYTLGEFAIGGCYILRREVVSGLETSGFLHRSPFRLLPMTGEDGIMTPHVYAVGYAVVDDVSDGGLFAIEGKHFRADPLLLKSRGHYVLHPLKYGYLANGRVMEEAELITRLM
jgi:hypothetical protein